MEPPNHTAYRCMWCVITWTSTGLGWKADGTRSLARAHDGSPLSFRLTRHPLRALTVGRPPTTGMRPVPCVRVPPWGSAVRGLREEVSEPPPTPAQWCRGGPRSRRRSSHEAKGLLNSKQSKQLTQLVFFTTRISCFSPTELDQVSQTTVRNDPSPRV